MGRQGWLRYSIDWPKVAGERGATGNDGMVKTIAATPYAVGYIGISFSADAAKAGLITIRLKNQSGQFVLPTAETVSAAAASLDPRTPPDERLSLVYAPGETSYPLINYEYAVLSTRQPDADTAAAIATFCCGRSRSMAAMRRSISMRSGSFRCRILSGR